MKVRHFVTKVAAVSALIVLAVPAHAGHAWGNYHWERSGNPLFLDLGNNVNSTWEGHLGLASKDWNIIPDGIFFADVLETKVVPGSTRPRQCRAQAGNVQVCNLGYGNNGWLGIAGISVSGGHITAGYVKVNDTYFDSPPYNTVEWRQLVMCQEVGHTFGLGHQDEGFDNKNLGTCMDYTSDPLKDDIDNTKPNGHDYQLLEDIYDHLEVSGGGGDDGGSCNPRSPKCKNGVSAADLLASMDFNRPANWGHLISEHGPMEVYEMDLGGGRKILTHVTWTLERAHNHGH